MVKVGNFMLCNIVYYNKKIQLEFIHSLGTAVLSRIQRYSKPFVYFPCPSPGPGHFFKESFLPLLKLVFKNQDLDTRCAHCYWGVSAARPSQQIELGNTHTYPPAHTHRHTHAFPLIFISVSIYIYVENYEFVSLALLYSKV